MRAAVDWPGLAGELSKPSTWDVDLRVCVLVYFAGVIVWLFWMDKRERGRD